MQAKKEKIEQEKVPTDEEEDNKDEQQEEDGEDQQEENGQEDEEPQDEDTNPMYPEDWQERDFSPLEAFDLRQWPALEVARQLSILEQQDFKAIKSFELVGGKYSQKRMDKEAPHVANYVKNFNNVSLERFQLSDSDS